MKRKSVIIIVFLLLFVLAITLVGCGEIPGEKVNGNYYKVDKESGAVEILTINGNEFEVKAFTVPNMEVFPEKYEEISVLYAELIENSAEVYKGTCTYTNNAFIKNRLDLEYKEGKSGSTYVYLSEEPYSSNEKRSVFIYSPKMPMILLYALLGFCITLAVLCLLMGIIKLLGFSVDKIGEGLKKRKVNKVVQEIEDKDENVKLAVGSAGELKLENVCDRDAAMIMAIVADEMKEPLNSLRFISIKDITDKEGKE